MSLSKPFSQACENNKEPILGGLRAVLTAPGTVLEIGTGTGQHAVHFAAALPHLTWQPSDVPGSEQVCLPWLREQALANIAAPVALDVMDQPWPVAHADAVFSANTAHIMSWPEVEAMFSGIAAITAEGTPFCLYGPFNYSGRHTSESNRRFDESLRSQSEAMGIRDMEDLTRLGTETGLILESDMEMPANNRLLVWRRVAPSPQTSLP